MTDSPAAATMGKIIQQIAGGWGGGGGVEAQAAVGVVKQIVSVCVLAGTRSRSQKAAKVQTGCMYAESFEALPTDSSAQNLRLQPSLLVFR